MRDLLEDVIYYINDCMYISDLKTMIHNNDTVGIKNSIEKLESNDYAPKQWLELLNYLFPLNKQHYKTEQTYDEFVKLIEEKIHYSGQQLKSSENER